MKKLFISHHQEVGLANRLADLIYELFPGKFDISVAPADISLGEVWITELWDRLNKTDLLIALCSDGIRQHPWIWFESGAAFVRNANSVIPACYGGLNVDQLPHPFTDFQAFNLIDYEGLPALVRRLAALSTAPIPSFDINHSINSLREAITVRPALEEVLKKSALVPSEKCQLHLNNLPHRPSTQLSAIDDAILLYHTPSLEPFGAEKVRIVSKHNDFPELLELYPKIQQLKTDIPVERNKPKYFISAITYPGSDLSSGRLDLELGHSNYRANAQLQAALSTPIDDQGSTLRTLYENSKLDYRNDLPNMIIIKCIVIAQKTPDEPEKVLFIKRPGPRQTDYLPNHWTLGIDEQMQATPVSQNEANYGDEEFLPDADLFAAAKRGLREELGIPAETIQSLGFLALFREYANYNVNALFVARTNIKSIRLQDYSMDAEDPEESRVFEWRIANIDVLTQLLVRSTYQPENSKLPSGLWHPDSRLRLLLCCFSLFGAAPTLEALNSLT